MAAPQGPDDKPTAPYGGDLPPPYSAVVTSPHTGSDAAGAGGYPQMGFVTGPAPVHTAPPNTYPHPQYPQSGAFPQQGVMIAQMPGGPGQMPVNVIVAPPVGTEPVNMYCTSCTQQITTKVDYRTSWHTHLIAGIICFSTMFFSMCCLGLVPYCLDSCKNAEHYCPNCNAYLGKYERC